MFLLPRMPRLPWYQMILDRVRRGAVIVDVGCCFGQDLRFLAAGGAPTEKMFATDIVSDFWDLSYDLFRDKDSFQAHFNTADVLDSNAPLGEIKSEADILLVNQVFHLFNRERQVAMAKNLVACSRPDTWIVGWHIGSVSGRALPVGVHTGGATGSAGGDTKLFHNDDTWTELWQQVGAETGTQWSIETAMQPLEEWGYEKEDTAWMGPNPMGFEFICRRIK